MESRVEGTHTPAALSIATGPLPPPTIHALLSSSAKSEAMPIQRSQLGRERECYLLFLLYVYVYICMSAREEFIYMYSETSRKQSLREFPSRTSFFRLKYRFFNEDWGKGGEEASQTREATELHARSFHPKLKNDLCRKEKIL